jgi:short-subunit dehydrogenase
MSWIKDKRVVVTGATSGIGREVATALAAEGAEVFLACRDGARAATVARDIATSTSRPVRC